MEITDTKKHRGIFEQLSNTTVRITAKLPNGLASIGTGFLYQFGGFTDLPLYAPCLVTNKHVVAGCNEISLLFTEGSINAEVDTTKHVTIVITGVQNLILNHPDPLIDLCVIPIGEFIRAFRDQGKQLHFQFVDKSAVPTVEEFAELDAVEEVIVVGYPNGFWDKTNNKPIMRRGITATDPKLNYNGKPQFLIDSAIFQGSSGSPVFIANSGAYNTRNGLQFGTRFFFIGIAYAIMTNSITGDIIQEPIETASFKVNSRMPSHIGVVIRISEFLKFEPLIEARLREQYKTENKGI